MAERVSRIYSNFRGVDFRGEEINLVRSPDSLNVWKDYKETESIRTRPDIEQVEIFDNKVFGIFFYRVANIEGLLRFDVTCLRALPKGYTVHHAVA